MGNAQRLLFLRDSGQLARDLLRCMTGNAGVDLIEDQHADILARGQHVFERQHDAAQLTARGHLGERLFRLARVDRDLKCYRVAPMHRQLGTRMHCDTHFDLFHIQLSQFSDDLRLKPLCRRATRLGQFGSQRLGFCELFMVLFAQLVAPVVRVLQGLKLGCDLIMIRCDLCQRAAVFLLEPVDQVEPLLDPLALSG